MITDDKDQFDPYRSPAVDAILIDDADRPLTTIERRMLELYFSHRDRPFTMLVLVKRMLPNLCLIGAVFTILFIIAFAVLPGDQHLLRLVLAAVLGAIFGVVTRDIGVARHLIRMWPVLRSVFDWKHVEARLESYDRLT
ncbi:MAG: hypothetical protein VB835_16545 [Pirellulales bacterium]